MRKSLKSQRGFTILEALIASAVIIFISYSVMSWVRNITASSQLTSFRSTCSSYTRSKLQEYVSGKPMNGNYFGLAAKTGMSGFDYTKLRYQIQNPPTILTAGTNPSCSTTPNLAQPGFRENISNNNVAANKSPLESGGPQTIQGFQLWTSIRHVNPRVLSTGNQPSRDCPSAKYEFLEVGDALEVTITGMIRVRPSVAEGGRGGSKFGDLDDIDNNTPNPQLSCSTTQTIYPPRIPFRYYLGKDGKVRTFQNTVSYNGSAANGNVNYSGTEYAEAHFRHLWAAKPDVGSVSDTALANIRGIAISPDNTSAYVLRSGEITQYTSCNDSNLNGLGTPSIDGKLFSGMPDCNLNSATTTWTVDPNISGITVNFNKLSDFNDDDVYVFYNSGTVQALSTDTSSTVKMLKHPPGGGAGTVVAPTGNFRMLNSPRVKGIFLAQPFPAVTSPSLYYYDNTCIGSSGFSNDGTYCTTIFNSGDTVSGMDVRELPVQVQGISY